MLENKNGFIFTNFLEGVNMAQVTAKVLGGQLKEFDVSSIAELKSIMGLGSNYAATVNGETFDGETSLNDYDFVTLSPAVKGGQS